MNKTTAARPLACFNKLAERRQRRRQLLRRSTECLYIITIIDNKHDRYVLHSKYIYGGQWTQDTPHTHTRTQSPPLTLHVEFESNIYI